MSFWDDYHNCEETDYYSRGWLRTNGDNGIVEWNGIFMVKFEDYDVMFSVYSIIRYFVGVEGFTGIWFPTPLGHFFYGTAPHVVVEEKTVLEL